MAMNPAELAAQAAQRKTATENPEAVSYDPADLDIAMGDIMRQIDDAMADSAVNAAPESESESHISADGTVDTHAEAASDAAESVVAAFERAHHTLHETLENAHVPTQVSAHPVEGSF